VFYDAVVKFGESVINFCGCLGYDTLFRKVCVITFMQEPAASITRTTKSQILRSYHYTECLDDTRIALFPLPPPPQPEVRQYVVGIIHSRGLEKHENEITSCDRCLYFLKIHKCRKQLLAGDNPAWR
jgi:hypothetical protein